MAVNFTERAKAVDLSKTLTESWSKITAERADLIRLGWIPLLVTTAFSLFITYYSVGSFGIDPNETMAPNVAFGQAAAGLVQFVGYAVFAVSAHRLFVLGERPKGIGQFRFARNEGLFFVFIIMLTIAIGIGAAVFAVVVVAVPAPAFLKMLLIGFAALAALAVATAVSLVLPRIAIEGRFDAGRAWLIGVTLLGPFLLRQIALALLWVVIVLIAMVAIGIVVVPIIGIFGTSTGEAVATFALMPFSAAATAHGVALLSVLYERTLPLWDD